MPLTIKELREQIPKTNRAHIDEDISKNNVLANMRKLYDLLAPGKDDFAAGPLRKGIKDVLQAVDGKGDEAEADRFLTTFMDTVLHTVYMRDAKNAGTKIFENNKDQAKELIQYIALGLDLEDRYDATEEQKTKVKAKRDADKAAAAEAALKAEEKRLADLNKRNANIAMADNARLKEEQKKDVYTILEELKARINKFPKANSLREFSQEFLEEHPTVESREAVLKDEVKDFVRTFMAMRFALRQTRNDVGQLKRKYDDETYRVTSEIIQKCDTLNDFMDSMSYSDLKSLALKGHGGAFEEAFQKYVRNLAPAIPEDVPQYYMPKGIDRINALKDHISSRSFMQKDAEDRFSTYMEILAVRESLNAKRGDKDTLSPTIKNNEVIMKKEALMNGGVAEAMRKIIERDGEAVIRDAATPTFGHGGKIEDLLKSEIRAMGKDMDQDFRLPDVPKRFAPTYQDRVIDVCNLIQSNIVNPDLKLERCVELSHLNYQRQTHQDNDNIVNTAELNKGVAYELGVLNKIMNQSQKNEIIADFAQHGPAATKYEQYKATHKGEIAAGKILQDIEYRSENDELTIDDIKVLAAKKLYIDKQLSEFKWDKNPSQELLESQVNDFNVNQGVNEILKNKNFNRMCEELGLGALQAKFKEGNYALLQQFAVYNDNNEEVAPQENEINAPQKQEVVKQNENGNPEIQLIQ